MQENKIIYQTKLDSSTQNPKQKENVVQKTKSCTRLNWTPALKIPEQRGNALQITNLNNEVPRNIRTISASFTFDQFQKIGSLHRTKLVPGTQQFCTICWLLGFSPSCFWLYLYRILKSSFVFLYYRSICKIVLAQ